MLLLAMLVPIGACAGERDTEAGSAAADTDTAEATATDTSGEASAVGESMAAGAESMSSGIAGRAVIGPACPAERVDEPCPQRPYPTRLTVVDPATGEALTTVECDEEGYFRVDLPPGSYRIEPPETQVVTAPRADPMTVDVEAGEYTEITLRFDSGMR